MSLTTSTGDDDDDDAGRQNFIVYGQAGFKADFGAHDMRASDNYYAYVDVPSSTNKSAHLRTCKTVL